VNDTWTHIVAALSPNYDSLKRMLDQGPTIKCTLSRKGKITVLRLVEQWEDDGHQIIIEENTKNFDDYVHYIEEELVSWPNVRRMAWDKWYFTSYKNAEKFLILFNLKWGR